MTTMSRATELKRTPFKRTMPTEPKPPNVPRESRSKCEVCRKSFVKANGMQVVCGLACSIAKVQRDKIAKAKDERKKDKAKKRDQMKLSEFNKEAQKAFNAWVRFRDRDKGCICCGKPFGPMRPGGNMDAGHYLSRGSAQHLRFDERNVFGQRKNCNRPGGTTRQAFRDGVISRIGLEAVEALESDQTIRHYTREELEAITATYRAKLKALKEQS